MKLFITLFLSFSFLLSGCQYNTVTHNPEFVSSTGWSQSYANGLETKYQNFPQYLKLNYETATPDQKTLIRNQIVNDLLYLSDFYYQRDTQTLYNDNNAFNFGSSILNLGLSAAATITGGTEAKTVLSGLSAFTAGTTAAYNADYLHNETVTAIINDMNQLRQSSEAKILNNLTQSDAAYPLEPNALKDVFNYNSIGIIAAVQDLQNQTSQENAQQNKTLEISKENYKKAMLLKTTTTKPS